MSVHNKDIIIMMNAPGRDTTGLLATKKLLCYFCEATMQQCNEVYN